MNGNLIVMINFKIHCYLIKIYIADPLIGDLNQTNVAEKVEIGISVD